MPDDAKPARIRWQWLGDRESTMAFTGHAGTADPDVFAIFEPDTPFGDYVLETALSGMRNRKFYGTPGRTEGRGRAVADRVRYFPRRRLP